MLTYIQNEKLSAIPEQMLKRLWTSNPNERMKGWGWFCSILFVKFDTLMDTPTDGHTHIWAHQETGTHTDVDTT